MKTRENKRYSIGIILMTGLLMLGLFSSCSKSPKCWGKDKNKGIISASVEIKCHPDNEEKQFIIDSDSAYHQVFQSVCELPEIDFNSTTLLGLYAEGNCTIKYIREVEKQENNYHYKIIVKSCGTCKCMGYSFNWVTVPKLPQEWGVTFEVVNK